DYKKVIQNCVTLTSNNIERAAKESQAEKAALAASGQSSWQMRNTGKTYTVLGFVHGLHPFRTKKGTDMAFAKLSDYNGEMDLTFFSKTWETLKTQVQDGKIAAFKGKVDGSREQPSFIVDSIEDPSVLKERSIKEVHIEIENSFQSEAEVSKIKDFLFAQNGNCSLYFHIDTASGPFIVKANSQLTVSSSKEVLSQIEDLPLVKDVWCE
ncbi:MAG: DNA polymerase III subunit alpha, partial [Treponema porcinum]|nr:DNA polymerase III subunit alpha [Treponema porcinum]